jgi:D-alanine transfer protein
LGPAIRGKKVVLSVSPGFFLLPQLDAPAYGFNFSHLHACELAFSSDLSRELKRDAAKRMRRYPATLKDDRVLDYALKGLAEDSPLSTFGYFLALPLGKLQCQVLELQDHWATLEYIREQPGLEPDVPHATVSLDWTALAADGDRRARTAVTNNQFGIADDYWVLSGATWLRQKNTLSDQVFTNKLNSSLEWIDLELVLRELAELGAQPLVLSQPFHGMYYDFMGVSPRARSQYYDRLEKLAKKYGVSLVDYREYEQDKYFPEDPLGHMSPKGWLLFDQAINTFYHAAAH